MSEPDRTRLASYADSPRDTLILLDILALLHFGTRRVVDLLHAHVLLTATKLGRVDGDKEALDATRLCVLDVLLRDLAVAVDIELEEERLVVGLGVEDVVEGARRERSDLSGGVSTMSAIGRGGEVGRAIWMTPWLAEARVRQSSPSGCPSFPKAVADWGQRSAYDRWRYKP